jgi:hypothetical protein
VISFFDGLPVATAQVEIGSDPNAQTQIDLSGDYQISIDQGALGQTLSPVVIADGYMPTVNSTFTYLGSPVSLPLFAVSQSAALAMASAAGQPLLPTESILVVPITDTTGAPATNVRLSNFALTSVQGQPLGGMQAYAIDQNGLNPNTDRTQLSSNGTASVAFLNAPSPETLFVQYGGQTNGDQNVGPQVMVVSTLPGSAAVSPFAIANRSN